MSRADYVYYLRRADEEQANVERATTLEAKSAHQQLHDLYLVRLGHTISAPGFTVAANAGA